VIVHDLHVAWAFYRPGEADPILVIDTNAVLPATVARECLQVVARRYPKFLQANDRIQLLKLACCNCPQGHGASPTRSLGGPAVEHILDASTPERSDHMLSVAWAPCYVKSLA